MKMDFQKIRERLGLSSDKPLTPEEKRRRARYIVYPFFCLLCAGFLLLVFSPSEKDKAEKEKGKGFNVEMPSPKDSEMEGDKVSAYEQEALAKKEKWRRGTFQEMSELLNKDSQDTAGLTAGKANTELPPEPETGKSPGFVHSSAEAYRNMNRSLGAVYTRNENQQKCRSAPPYRGTGKRKETGGRTAGRTDPGRKDGTAGKVLRAGRPVQREAAGCPGCREWPERPERQDSRPPGETGTESGGVIACTTYGQ